MDLKTGLIAWAITNGKKGWIDPKLRIKKDPKITVNLWVRRDGFTKEGDHVLRRPNGPSNSKGFGSPKFIHHSKVSKPVTFEHSKIARVQMEVPTALDLV